MKIISLSLAVFLLGASPTFAGSQAAALTSQADIIPILEMSMSENAQSELKFGNVGTSSLGPTTTPSKMITIEVLSNTGQKYILTQAASGPLDNGQGSTIGLENLKFKTAALRYTGHPVSDFTAVASSSQTIFASDELGSSETVSAEYQLSIPPSQAPGDYSALLTFTVSSV